MAMTVRNIIRLTSIYLFFLTLICAFIFSIFVNACLLPNISDSHLNNPNGIIPNSSTGYFQHPHHDGLKLDGKPTCFPFKGDEKCQHFAVQVITSLPIAPLDFQPIFCNSLPTMTVG